MTQGGGARLPGHHGGQVAAPRRRGLHRRGAEDVGRQVLQEGPAGPLRRLRPAHLDKQGASMRVSVTTSASPRSAPATDVSPVAARSGHRAADLGRSPAAGTLVAPGIAPFDQVLTSAKAGFPSAFEHLFALLARSRWPPTSARRGPLDPAGSANDVLLRVFQGLGRFEGDERPVPGLGLHHRPQQPDRRAAPHPSAGGEVLPIEAERGAAPGAARRSDHGALDRLGNRDAVGLIESPGPRISARCSSCVSSAISAIEQVASGGRGSGQGR